MWLIYNVQVYSKVIQLYAYVTLYYINILFQIFYWKVILFFAIDYSFLLKLLQDIEYSFLCYTVGPCCFIYFICSIVYLLIPSLFFKDWFLRLPFVLFFPFNLKDNIIVSVILGRKGDTNTHPQCHQIIMLLSFFFFLFISGPSYSRLLFKSMSSLTSTSTGRSMLSSTGDVGLGPVTYFGLMRCEVYFLIPLFCSVMWFTLLLFWLCHVRP